jgi:hypothetical protein
MRMWTSVFRPGLGLWRNIIISPSEAVVALGGGAGKLCEMANAWAPGRLIIAYRVERLERETC